MSRGLGITLAAGALALAAAGGFVLTRTTPSAPAAPATAALEPAAAPATAQSDLTAPSTRAEDAEPQYVCPDNAGSRSFTYGSVRLETRRDDMDSCGFTLFKADGSAIADGEGPVILLAQYADLDADRVPELLIVAATGGSLGLNDSILVTQVPDARVMEVPPGCEPRMEPAPDGNGRVLAMCDQSFTVVELMCNACAPRPRMFYRLEEGALVLRNTRYPGAYDRHIRELEAQVTPADLDAFLKAEAGDEAAINDSVAAQVTLRVAADYAYSGRASEATRVLTERWPAWDRERVSELVLSHAIEP